MNNRIQKTEVRSQEKSRSLVLREGGVLGMTHSLVFIPTSDSWLLTS